MILTDDALIHRIHRELIDHGDEELELELAEDAHNLDELFDQNIPESPEKAARRRYFR